MFFCGYAYRVPMASKLYKEGLKSIILGTGVGLSFVYWQKIKYNKCVDETYDFLKDKLLHNPTLAAMKEDQLIIKNFGFHKYADPDTELEDIEEREMGIFEGDPDKERDMYKRRLASLVYGSTDEGE